MITTVNRIDVFGADDAKLGEFQRSTSSDKEYLFSPGQGQAYTADALKEITPDSRITQGLSLFLQ